MTAVEPPAAPVEAPAVEAPVTPVVEQGAVTVPEPRNTREAIEQQRGNRPAMVADEPVEPPAPTDPAAAALAEAEAKLAAGAPPAAPVVPEGTDPYAEFGGRLAVEEAMQVRNGLQTEMGVRAVVAQGLTALGYDPAAVKTFLDSPEGKAQVAAAGAPPVTAPAVVDPYAGIADDEMVTGLDVKTIVQTAIDQAVARTTEALTGQVAQTTEALTAAQQNALLPLQQAFAQQQQAAITQATDSTLVELLGPVPADPAEAEAHALAARGVLDAAMAYVNDDYSPANIRLAVQAGHAVFERQQEARYATYLRAKVADAAKIPTPVGAGSSPGGETLPEPKNMKEAIAQRKAQGIL